MSKQGNNTPTRLWRASSGTPIRLGGELGRGGEGAVFDVQGDALRVAKIYLKPPTRLKIEKIATMTRVARPNLLGIAAWPIESLVDEHKVVRGFLMPKVSGREDLHELYSPKSRAETFPEADFRFVVRVAANLARAFATLHAQGHVVGDVNHGNALVGRDATVMLIDCDSIQTRDRVKTYPCDVGVPLFTAPELQGKDFRGLRRSANHDSFGLAVLIFHLLFQGRHPFAGRFAHGEITIERAIAEHRFAYSATPDVTGMAQPPGTLPLHAFGPQLAELFRRSFEVKAGEGERPKAVEWVDALGALEQSLVGCRTVRVHFHPPGAPCCWCELEGRSSIRYFGRRLFDAGRSQLADAEALWRAVANVPHPGPPPPLPAEQLGLPAQAGDGRTAAFLARWGVTIGLAICTFIAVAADSALGLPLFWITAVVAAKARDAPAPDRGRKNLIANARETWTALLELWNEECTSARFDERLAELKGAYLQMNLLATQCKTEIEQYVGSSHKRSLRNFLRRLRVDQIALLTRAQRTKLISYGIRTAVDIEREIKLIPHILSSKAAEALLLWYRAERQGFVDGFTGAPDTTVDADEIAAIRQHYEQQRAPLAKQLQEGVAVLQEKREQIEAARRRMTPALRSSWEQLNKAQSE